MRRSPNAISRPPPPNRPAFRPPKHSPADPFQQRGPLDAPPRPRHALALSALLCGFAAAPAFAEPGGGVPRARRALGRRRARLRHLGLGEPIRRRLGRDAPLPLAGARRRRAAGALLRRRRVLHARAPRSRRPHAAQRRRPTRPRAPLHAQRRPGARPLAHDDPHGVLCASLGDVAEPFVEIHPADAALLSAAALVWSKAPVIVGAHDTGPLIRSRNQFWLAIPTPAAGRGLRGGKITPGERERRRGLRLRFVYRRRRPSLLVAEGRLSSRGLGVASSSKTGRGRATALIFLLVPQVKLPKRLDLARDAERAHDAVPGLIVANWLAT